MTPARIDWSGTPDEIEAVAEALSRLLGAELKRSPRLLSPLEIFDAMRSIAGVRCWDAMPIADSVGAVRLMWRGPNIPSAQTRYLLVTWEGNCYVEGRVPGDPLKATDYLAVRRRYLISRHQSDGPAYWTQDGYEALIDGISGSLADLVPSPETEPTKH